jgi:hypothetical protein
VRQQVSQHQVDRHQLLGQEQLEQHHFVDFVLLQHLKLGM